METYLETARLTLRQLTTADADLLVELDADPEVMFFITGGRASTRAEIEERDLPGFIRDYPSTGCFAAIEKESGAFLGWFQLSMASPGDRSVLELGYRLRRAAWGRGYAAEGSRALVDKAFGGLGADRVYAETMTVNTRSRRVMEKAGLRFVRTFFADWPDSIPGDDQGDVEYALTREEWAAGR